MKKEITLISPIVLNSTIKSSIEILPKVFLSELSKEEQTKYFNIIHDEYGMGNVCVSTNDPVQPDPLEFGFRLACWHKVTYPKTEFNTLTNSLRLLKTNNFGIKYIRGDEYKDLPYFPCCLYIPQLALEIQDIPELNRIYELIKQNSNNIIMNNVLERFDLVLGENGIPSDIKFKELITILEMIYLPNEEYQITKKFAKRISIIFHKFHNIIFEEFYKIMEKNYKIRSKLAHHGIMNYDFENKDNPIFIDLLDVVRKSIILLLEYPAIFNEANLKKLDEIKF